MTVAVYDNTLLAALPPMADALMTAIETLGLCAVQPPHALYEMGFRRFDAHVIMIVHQAIRGAAPPLLGDLLPHDGEQTIAVGLIEKDSVLGIASGCPMIHGTRKLYA